MTRLFLQLYLLIAATLIGVGWGLEQLWQVYNNKSLSEKNQPENILLIVENTLKYKPVDRWVEELTYLSNITGLSLLIFELGELSGSSIQGHLSEGRVTSLQSTQGHRLILKKVAGHDKVLAIKQQYPLKRTILEWVLMLILYGAIALVIMIWLWPLSRDLKKLERATQSFGKQNWQLDLDIKPSAQMYSLAQAFQKMAQRIEALIGSHKDMSNAISHEIKTPLARMKFELAMVENSNDIKQIKEHIINIKTDITEVNDLATATLDYAVLERADFSLNLTQQNFSEVVRGITEYVTNTIVHHQIPDIEIEFFTHNDDNDVICDIHLMERVVKNLLYNALKYANQKVTITFGIKAGIYRLCVEDDGPGIPEEDKERIFHSFVRLANNNSNQDGFGLGLAIVKRIIEWHNGRIAVTRSLLGGARFVVSWPRPSKLQH